MDDPTQLIQQLYAMRAALVIAFFHAANQQGLYVWKSKTDSKGVTDKDYFAVGISDRITFHMPMAHWNDMVIQEIPKGIADGHVSEDVIKRLINMEFGQNL